MQGSRRAPGKNPSFPAPPTHPPFFQGAWPQHPHREPGAAGEGDQDSAPHVSLYTTSGIPKASSQVPHGFPGGPFGVLTLQARDYPGSSGKPGGEGADPGEALRGGQRQRGGPSRPAGRPAGELGSRGTGAACRAAPTPPPFQASQHGAWPAGPGRTLRPAPRTPHPSQKGRARSSVPGKGSGSNLHCDARPGGLPGVQPSNYLPRFQRPGPAW